MRFLKYIALLIFALIHVPLSSAECNNRGQAGQISEGENDDPPKNYPLIPLEFKNLPSEARLWVDKDRKARIYLHGPDKSLKDLDKTTAYRIFCNSKPSGSSCDTFHVVGAHASGPNIFHVDVEFNNAQLLSRYRVRGFGILKPEWQQVQ